METENKVEDNRIRIDSIFKAKLLILRGFVVKDIVPNPYNPDWTSHIFDKTDEILKAIPECEKEMARYKEKKAKYRKEHPIDKAKEN